MQRGGPAVVGQCGVSTNGTYWTHSASCQFDKAYSSNGQYRCKWYRQQGRQSTRQILKNVDLPTTETSVSGKVYHSGECTLQPSAIPKADGTYTFTVAFTPGLEQHVAGTVTIRQPSEPPVHTCPPTLYEGQDVQCTCQPSPSSASPPPAVHWQGRQPGEQLILHNVSRNDTERRFLCVLTWGPPVYGVQKTSNYTLNVAYGPDDVTITQGEGAHTSSPSPTTNISTPTLTLVCSAIRVSPSAVFRWSGVHCSSNTSDTSISTCTFTWTPGRDVTAVTCTAHNSLFPQRFHQTINYTVPVTPTYTVPVTPTYTGPATQTPTSAPKDSSTTRTSDGYKSVCV
ncbi:hypothetical protein ACOMHN_031879 [Nucella lapillus]